MANIAPSSHSNPHGRFPPWIKGYWGFLGMVLIFYTLVFLLWTYFHWGGEESISLIGNLAILPPLFFAALMDFRVALQSSLDRRLRRAWLLLGLGTFSFFLGNATWTYLESVLGVEPFPSIADFFFLGSYPLIVWGLFTLPGAALNSRERLIFLLDLVIVMTSASMFVGYFLIVPTAAVNNSDLLAQILATAYPVSSLIVLGGIVALLLRPTASGSQTVLFLILTSFSFFLASDLLFGYASMAGTYVAGTWIDSGWHISSVFMVLAALRQVHQGSASSTRPRELFMLSRFVRLLPWLTIVMGYGLLFYVVTTNYSQVSEWLFVTTVFLTILIIARQIFGPGFSMTSLRTKLILTFLLVCVVSIGLVSLFTYLTWRSHAESAGQALQLATLMVLVLTTGIAVFLSQWFVAPVSRLTAVARQIAMGNLSAKAQVESQDEIGILAGAFNTMLETLSRTQRELQESEILYRSLVDYSPDMIAVHGRGKILFVNPAGAELMGAKSPDELIGQPLLNEILQQDRAPARPGIEETQDLRMLAPLSPPKIRRLDGLRFEADIRAIPISYMGEPAFQLIVRDITERKMAEEKIHQLLAQLARHRGELEKRVEERTAELNLLNERLQKELVERQRLVQSLRDHERQLAQAVTLARMAYWELDLRTSEFTFNDQFYNVLRTTAQKAGGYTIPAERYLRQFVHSQDISRIAERMQAARTATQTSSTGQVEYRCICGDGQIQDVLLEYQIVFDAQGRSTRVFGAHMDITERQRLMRSLSDSESRFRLLFEASPDAILLIDPHDPHTSWPIVDCNEAACRMNGFTREELIGQSIDSLNADSPKDTEREEYLNLIRQKGILNYEAVHRNKAGHPFPVEVSTSMIEFADRELILGIDRDITERKQTQDALRQAKDIAEAASRAKSEFLSRMSHELRTPMNAILGFAQLLELSQKEPLTSTQKERVRQIAKGGQHLLDLINEILDISRIEANRLQVSPEPVAVRESIQEVLDLTVPLAVKRHIQIVTKLGSMDVNPFVMADRQRLKQVLLNLLGNAVKYNYDGGSVIITYQQTSSEKLRISITDTGPGIAEENLTRLFMPFERLAENEPSVEGTGLGLVLAKRLIELMHGQIGVESVLGKGSTFWVELPTAEDPVERLQRTGVTRELSVSLSPAQTILYVEDNIANFELIQQVLADYSQFKLLWATDGRTGIESARQHRPDLILLDLHLGNMDGRDVLLQLKQDEEMKKIPVVIVSADATTGQAEQLISLGAEAYLTKPLNVKHFVHLVEELLGEKEI